MICPIERIIYGDVLIIINFSMDFLALYITAKIMHLKLNSKRITLSSLIGALYSLVILSLNLSSAISGIISLAMAFLLTVTAYGKQKRITLLKNTVVFYIVNFALGGGITAICNILNIWQNKRNLMINGTFDVLYGDLPFGLLVLLALLCGAFSLVSGKLIKKKSAEKSCSLHITFNQNSTTLEALVDSGNLLREPLSGKPVIITAFNDMRKLIPIELIPLFKNKDTGCLGNNLYSAKVRIIPISTVNGNNLLFGLLPDKVSVDEKIVDVYVAITSDNDNFGGFSAVVPLEITQ
ncbi:MAG: sigma-E processing peptidase SpoIIGA [Clostridia bacterium]|nr:sigma-E processing peptidase SpoIIGA [Clostridia bacterium]